MKKLSIPSPGKNQRPIKLVAVTDLEKAEEMFKSAAVHIVPEFQTQKQAFEKLIPNLYVLRKKGCSIQQLTGLLKQFGFDLQPSTVRDYYRDGVAKQLDICQERMNEYVVLLKKLRKQKEGAELSEITERFSAAIKQRKIQAASKMDAIFGALEPMAHTENKNEGLGPAKLF
jgi:hypothetical protein